MSSESCQECWGKTALDDLVITSPAGNNGKSYLWVGDCVVERIHVACKTSQPLLSRPCRGQLGLECRQVCIYTVVNAFLLVAFKLSPTRLRGTAYLGETYGLVQLRAP